VKKTPKREKNRRTPKKTPREIPRPQPPLGMTAKGKSKKRTKDKERAAPDTVRQ
jgi:hypothetical protein